MTDLPAIIRPNGKTYQPKKIVVQPWQDDNVHGWKGGAVVLGTHDIDVARPIATELIGREFDQDLVALKPEPGWYRLGFEHGERTWLTDEVHGRAGVWFRADYPPTPAPTPSGGTAPKET